MAALAATAVVVVVVVVVAVVGVVGAVVVDGLVGSTKKEQVSSLAGLGPWPCPSPAFDGSGSFAGSVPSLQKNKNKENELETNTYIPTHSLKMRGLVKHILGQMSLPWQHAWKSRSRS